MTPARKIDLHVHSSFSPDGRSSVDELARRAQGLGLAGFALTDHNTTRGHARLAAVRSDHPTLLLVPGVEISTEVGHLLAYGLSEAPPRGRGLAETVDWVVGHGGEPVLAHPFRWPHGAGRHLGVVSGLRTVETLNGHNGPRTNRRAAELAARRGLRSTGGSDAHAAVELGRAFSEFPETCASVDDVLEALRRGTLVATGRSLSASGWIGWALRTGSARARRGLRPL